MCVALVSQMVLSDRLAWCEAISSCIKSLRPDAPPIKVVTSTCDWTAFHKTVSLDSVAIGVAHVGFRWPASMTRDKTITVYVLFDSVSKCLKVCARTGHQDVDLCCIPQHRMEEEHFYPLLLLASREGLTDWRPS